MRVLTRDKYLNPSSEKAKNVTGELKLLEKAEGAKVMPVANSNTLSRDPNAQPSRYDQCLARYKGSGIHEVDFVREIAGRYEAGATLRDERVMSKGGGEHGLTLIVAPTAVEPTMCTCRELPRHIVDPGAIKAALERERIRAQQEHERRQQGEGETGLSLGASHFHYVPPACMPEGVTGTMEITTYDRFGNLCDGMDFKWCAEMIAQEAWEPEVGDEDGKVAVPSHLQQEIEPAANGETWIEPAGNGIYRVMFRALSGRYDLRITDPEGTHCGKSPFGVLIIPPVGGPRPHGHTASAPAARLRTSGRTFYCAL